MPDPTLSAPADWAAITCGQYDASLEIPYDVFRAYGQAGGDEGAPCFWPLPKFIDGRWLSTRPAMINGHWVTTGPAPPLWRTICDYHQSHIDIALGAPELDSPTWLPARSLRERALAREGVGFGVVPLSYLAAISIPGDFSATELIAQSSAASAFVAGQPLPEMLPTDPPLRFWPALVPTSPLVSLPSWAASGPRNSPISPIGSITSSFVLTLARESLPILAAARALSVRELPLWLVYS